MALNLWKRKSSNYLRLINLAHSRLFSTESSSPSPPFKTFQAAKKALLDERNPDKFADLFITQSSSYPAFVRHRPIYRRAVRRLSLLKRDDLIDRILTHQKTVPTFSEGLATRIITLYSSAGMVNHTLGAFNDIFVGDSKLLTPTQQSLCALLTALLKAKMFDKFDDVFETYPKKLSIPIGVTTYNLALRSLCERGRLDSAKELLRKMKEELGLVPDIVSYNILLSACLKVKDTAGFAELHEECQELDENVTTCNLRIKHMCRNKEFGEAMSELHIMEKWYGASRNPTTYNLLIDGLCKAGEWKYANEMVDNMRYDENPYINPCSWTYFTMFKNMVKKGEYGLGLDVCKKILEKKWVPPFEAMEGLMKGLVGMSRGEDAKEVVAKMKERLKGPAIDSWAKIEATLAL